ncbi:MAG: hypothetical protein U9Q06_02800 [Nanoarchaeota archaeon]|nr:hypothetical protein [Nanoarchaeota archaeon]
MDFCKKCGKLIMGNEEFEKCSCGFINQTKDISSSEKLKHPRKKGRGIIYKKESEDGFPHKCKKCGHEFSEVTDLGASYGDEASVYLFKCKKCKHTERDAYGASNG